MNELFVFLFIAIVVIAALAVRKRQDTQRSVDRKRTVPPKSQQRATHRPKKLPPKFRPAEPRSKPSTPQSKQLALPPMPRSMVLEGSAYVIDGDTIVVQGIKIRLAGIDAPELHEPWGRKSKWEMVNICKGQRIRVALNGERSYDRLVGTCFLSDGTDIGAELIRRGYALDYFVFSQGKYRHLENPEIRRKLQYIRWKVQSKQPLTN